MRYLASQYSYRKGLMLVPFNRWVLVGSVRIVVYLRKDDRGGGGDVFCMRYLASTYSYNTDLPPSLPPARMLERADVTINMTIVPSGSTDARIGFGTNSSQV